MKNRPHALTPFGSIITSTILFFVLSGASLAQDLRIIGTNLYDFSNITALGNTNSPFIISGTVQEIGGQSIHLRRVTVDYQLDPRTIRDGPEGLLEAAVALKIAQSGVTPGRLSALSPSLRRVVMGVREIKKNHDSLLLNYPRACRIDDNLRVCAIPVSGRDAVFDYGMPVSLASATNYSTVYCVHGGSIKSQPIEQFIANLHTDVHKAFIRHSFQAEEGRPYSEFLLGLDYRNGWGTETNEALAIQWLQTAATAGSPEAQEFLRTNSPPPK